jgi:predicted aspartyl protease
MLLKAVIAASSALVVLSAPLAAASNSTVPFELRGARIYVQAYVNGKGPYLFAVDTGASGVGRADRRLVEALGLKNVGEAQNSDGVNTASINVVHVDSLRLGSLEKHDVDLLSRDYNLHLKPGQAPMMGIIGRDFFKDGLLTIDYPARRLSFTGGHLRRGDPGVVAYKGSFSIPVCFRRGCYDGEVDTGSSQGLVLPKRIVGAIGGGAGEHVGAATSANTEYELYRVRVPHTIRISGVTAANQEVIYSVPATDAINIGSDFLKDYVLTIDQRHHLLRISKLKR